VAEAARGGQSRPGGGADQLQHLRAFLSGAGQVITGQAELPGAPNDWYFDPSRPILNGVDENRETPIAEFPLFTYLYGDMHPTCWLCRSGSPRLAGCCVLHHRRRAPEPSGCRVVLGSRRAALGGFRGAHTWNYLTLMGLALVAAGWTSWLPRRRIDRQALVDFGVKAALLLVLSIGCTSLGRWFITSYNSVVFWNGSRTPFATI